MLRKRSGDKGVIGALCVCFDARHVIRPRQKWPDDGGSGRMNDERGARSSIRHFSRMRIARYAIRHVACWRVLLSL